MNSTTYPARALSWYLRVVVGYVATNFDHILLPFVLLLHHYTTQLVQCIVTTHNNNQNNTAYIRHTTDYYMRTVAYRN